MKIPYKLVKHSKGWEVKLNLNLKPCIITESMVNDLRNSDPEKYSYDEALKFYIDAGIDFLKWELLDRSRGLGFRDFHESLVMPLGDIIFAKDEESRRKALREVGDKIYNFCYVADYTTLTD